MTTVTFHTEGSRIVGFDACGHSGYAPEGEDIVCAAVTGAVRFAECVVNDVMGLHCPVKTRKREAAVSLRLPAELPAAAENTAQNLLAGMMVYLSQLHCEYPEFLEVMEAE